MVEKIRLRTHPLRHSPLIALETLASLAVYPTKKPIIPEAVEAGLQGCVLPVCLVGVRILALPQVSVISFGPKDKVTLSAKVA